jgi:WD40 repeat protein
MADIFISHSGKDNDVAEAISERLRRDCPTWSLFYDKDNIYVGQRWQERLRQELTSCRVVLALLSRNWLDSPWCFAEAVTADFRGKVVVGIETEDLTTDDLARAPPILHERQRVRLRDGDNRAWQKILKALDSSGLDPDEFPTVSPYPGLVAFDEKDAGVFFGRKQEITQYLGDLETLRGLDRPQMLLISGASGSGKSSLLRAGLIPRLRRKKTEWVVISPFEVAREPAHNLLYRISEALDGLGISTPGLDLARPPDDHETLAQVLDDALRQLERANQATDAWVLLPLDQAEALVTGDRPAGDSGQSLLRALAMVLDRRTRRVVVAATIRSEFVPRLETAFAGKDVRSLPAPLSAIGSLAEIIEKPAGRFGIDLEPGLSAQIVADVRTAEALPLLAYTLKALYDREKALHDRGGADRALHLTLDGYQSLGGVQGAIKAKLESALDPELTAEEQRALRHAFTGHLIREDKGAVEGERFLRRVVPRALLPRLADPVIDRLVNAGLLVSKTHPDKTDPEKKDNTIELAHERLIDDWPKLPLRTWLAQDADDRRLIDRLRQFFVYDATLPDGLLAQAEDLLQRDPELGEEKAAIVQLVRRSRWRRRIRFGGAAAVFFVVAISAVIAGWQAKLAQNQRDKARAELLATQARRATEAGTPDDIGRAGALALESIWIAREHGWPAEADGIEAARSALIHLPLAVLSHGGQVLSLAALADGGMASGGYDGKIKIWPKENTGEPVTLMHGSPVLSLAKLTDGRLASGGKDGSIKLWPKEGNREPVVLSQGSQVLSLAALAKGRMASGGEDGRVKLWPKEGTGEPVVLSHGKPVTSLAGLADGRLASGGEDGKIKLWSKEGTGEPVVLSHGSAVLSLAELADGRLASGGADGEIKLWRKEGMGEPVVLSHGGSSVHSLTVLMDGWLASGGDDGKIAIWPCGDTREPVVLPNGGQVLALTVLADGRLASGGGEEVNIKLWPKDGTGEPAVLCHDKPVLSLAKLRDGRLASGGGDGTIKVWPKDGMAGPVIHSHGSRVEALAVLADGRLASGGEDGDIKFWPKEGAGEPVVLPQGDPQAPPRLRPGITSLAVLADGRLAGGDEDGNIKLWSNEGTGAPTVLPRGSPVTSIAPLADGLLASGDVDGKIKLWPKEGTGKPVVLSHGLQVRVLSLAVLAAARLASGGDDGNIKLWSKKGKPEPGVRSHGNSVVSLVELADGRLASAGDDEQGKIKLWPKEGTSEPVVLSHGSPVFSLTVAADGRLASGGADGTIKLWLVDEQKLINALCLRAGRNLTSDEWARFIGSDTPWTPSCRDLPSNWRIPNP